MLPVKENRCNNKKNRNAELEYNKYFTYSIFSARGKEAFIICPPEYVEEKQSGTICHAKLSPVPLSSIKSYILSELVQLDGFDPLEVQQAGNLYFGTLSTIDGSAIESNLAKEKKYLDQSEEIQYLKDIIDDQYEIQMKRFGQTPEIYLKKGTSRDENE